MNWTIRLTLASLSLVLVSSGLFIKNHFNQGSAEAPAGLVAGQETDVLATLAPEVPSLPDSKISSYQQEKDLLRFTLESDLKKDEILNFYKTELPKDGFTKISENRYQINGKELELEVGGSPLDPKTIILLNYSLVPTK